MIPGIISKRPARPVALLGVSVVYVLLLAALFPRTYLENDNLGILYDILDGQTVMFMSVLLGRVLSFLYLRISDAVPWYGLLLYALSVGALWLSLFSVDVMCRDRRLKYAVFVLVAALYSRFIVTVGYNAASITIGFASLLALMVHLRIQARPRLLVVLGLGVLFAFSYLIRVQGIWVVLLFAAVVAGWEAVSRLRSTFRHVALFLVPLVLAYGADTALRTYAVSDEHREFQEWNYLRGRFHDFPVSYLNIGNEAILEANGWTGVEYELLLNWVFFDERKFNKTTLQNVFDHSVPLPADNGILFGEIVGHGWELLRDYWRYWIVLIVVAWYSFAGGRRLAVLLQAAQAGALLVGGAVMETYLRFPPRIACALFFGVALFAIFVAFRDSLGRGRGAAVAEDPVGRRHLTVMTLVLLAAAVSEIPVTVQTATRRGAQQKTFYESVDQVKALEPRFLVMQAGSALGAQLQDPLKVPRDRLPSVPGGWTIFSPRFFGFLENYGLDHGRNVIPYLVQRDRSYLVSNRRVARLLERYVRVTHKWNVRAVRIIELDERTAVYRLKMLRGKIQQW